MKNNKITSQDKKEYDVYISDSLPCIEQLKEYMSGEGKKLDYSPESLAVIDRFLKSQRKK